MWNCSGKGNPFFIPNWEKLIENYIIHIYKLIEMFSGSIGRDKEPTDSDSEHLDKPAQTGGMGDCRTLHWNQRGQPVRGLTNQFPVTVDPERSSPKFWNSHRSRPCIFIRIKSSKGIQTAGVLFSVFSLCYYTRSSSSTSPDSGRESISRITKPGNKSQLDEQLSRGSWRNVQ